MTERYFTVNITVETKEGELIAVWRTSEPFSDKDTAIGRALELLDVAHEEIELSFDRMDE